MEPIKRENKDIFLMIAGKCGIGNVFETKKKLDEVAFLERRHGSGIAVASEKV